MCVDPPPLVPEAVIASARAAYDQFLRQPPTYANAIEDAIIAYGRVFWSFRKAFEALIRKELGVERADAHARLPTRAASETLAATCSALIAERARAERAVRAAIATDATEYERLIREFRSLQHEIEEHLFGLRRLAERAADHPDVFSEIMETVRTFERGLAYLAREPNPKEICAAIDTYRERHAEARVRRTRETSPRIFR
jgi:hypothetical protein